MTDTQIKLVDLVNTADSLKESLTAYATITSGLSLLAQYNTIDCQSLDTVSKNLYTLHKEAEKLTDELDKLLKLERSKK